MDLLTTPEEFQELVWDDRDEGFTLEELTEWLNKDAADSLKKIYTNSIDRIDVEIGCFYTLGDVINLLENIKLKQK